MLVALRKGPVLALEPFQRKFLKHALRKLSFGVPATWVQPSSGNEWWVFSDGRISVRDVARVAFLLGHLDRIPTGWNEDDTSEARRRRLRQRAVDILNTHVQPWSSDPVGTELVEWSEWLPVQVGSEQVSLGFWCVDFDETANDGLGECVEFEERFKTVPIYDMEPLLDEHGDPVVDELGEPVLVERLEEVAFSEVRDVFDTANNAVKAQGKQVWRAFRAGRLGNLVVAGG